MARLLQTRRPSVRQWLLWIGFCLSSAIGCGSESQPQAQDDPDLLDALDSTDQQELTDDVPPDQSEQGDATPVLGTVLRYDLTSHPFQLPFPYDFYTLPDEDSPTGLRVALNSSTYSNAILSGMFNMMPAAYDAFETLEGFGPYGWISVELSGDPPLGFSQRPAVPPDNGGPVHLLVWDGMEILEEPPFEAMLKEVAEKDGSYRYFLDLMPLTPLDDGARLIVAVTTDLVDGEGQPVRPDLHFQVVAGLAPLPEESGLAERLAAERERLAFALDALDDYGIERERLAVAFDITLSHARAEMLAIGQRFRQTEALFSVEYTFDPDGDEEDNLLAPQDPGFPAQAVGSHIAFVARGEFLRRDFRHPDHLGGTFLPDSDGTPLLHHGEPASFWLAYPDTSEQGPYPLVLLVHGLNNSADGMWSLAVALAEAGIASLAFDLVEHGSDGLGTADFMPFDQPLVLRDNFRQAAIDVLTAVYLVKTMEADSLDLLPPGGDQAADLDSQRIGLLGHSLGSMVSITACALSPDLGAGVYAAGGGGLMYFIEAFLERFGLVGLVDGSLLHGFSVGTGHLLASGDPVLYARYCRPDPLAWVEVPHPVLMLEMVGEEVIPDESILTVAISMDLPQIQPVVLADPSLQAVPASGQTSGLVQYGGGDHGFIFPGGQPAEMVPTVQAQMVHYLDTYLSTGEAEIIHPYE
ncbi:MAG: hypothetical protein JW797_04870 [Bradymonadales bacterium]|nr:hypothetical protein [Bradymonadales bacterium]